MNDRENNDRENSEDLIAQLANRGWAVQADWLAPSLVRQLAEEARTQHANEALRPAHVGAARIHAPNVRGDQIQWLEQNAATPAQAAIFEQFEDLRQALNGQLTLGLFEFEAHFAFYAPGASYGRHVDRFRNDDARVLSVVLYLNDPNWTEADGGQLRLEVGQQQTVDLVPHGGCLVSFLSDRFPHEVLPAQRERLSIAGWFKRRAP